MEYTLRRACRTGSVEHEERVFSIQQTVGHSTECLFITAVFITFLCKLSPASLSLTKQRRVRFHGPSPHSGQASSTTDFKLMLFAPLLTAEHVRMTLAPDPGNCANASAENLRRRQSERTNSTPSIAVGSSKIMGK